MKFIKTLFSLIFLCVMHGAISQPPDIVKLEYYFDTDPGFGNGTAVTVSSGPVTNTTFNIDISGLTPGLHYVFFRALNADGVWSHVYKSIITKIETTSIANKPDITAGEYYIDDDPGYGNGTSITFTPDRTPVASFNIDLSGLSSGFHKVYFRMKDDNNKWSHNLIRNIVAVEITSPDPVPEIVNAEYFIDDDPGYGNGTPISVTSGKIIVTLSNTAITSLDEGFHRLYIRVQDNEENWSQVYIKRFFKVQLSNPTPGPDITKLEYFVDSDPGFGNGNEVTIAPDNPVDVLFEADIQGIIAGNHDLYVRACSETGQWSLINIIPFTVAEIELTALLQGPYDAGSMSTDLNNNGLLPTDQPYDSAPWNYAGNESVASIPNSTIVDWILLETRNGATSSEALIGDITSRHAAFMLSDGSIVGLDGSSNLSFNTGDTLTNFVVIKHRNHLGIISSQPLNFSDGLFEWDFSTGLGQAYNNEQTDLGSGIFGMVAGNANGDLQIDNNDMTDTWNLETGNQGYKNGDLNLDAQVNNTDKNEVWLPNLGSSSQLPEK
ncbi:MAG: hypothetical protein KQI35_18645 [Bacteroidetes bacterium]|nr:hypothetical protein [Bacteroidota bacterium]